MKYLIILSYALSIIWFASLFRLKQEINEIRPIITTTRTQYRHNNIPDGNTISAQVTAFSAVEFCQTNYAQRTYPNCNGNTFPTPSVAIRKTWLNQGYTKVYIPDFDTTFPAIGHTDKKTDIDIWTGNSQEAAFKIGNKVRTIILAR